ncbi:glycoside hydrolase [Pseudovirgaria hyperparasitica]|uniref:Glycoside hydrolase n=1 Tax=Pseudovirgaria hyperparasitica TaxID=470096 RepID=A0A6A6W3Q7_9PEZI|nr:glycoside hydrolase [Pseudovirgaria hyperparasitica]KAF2757195.1 glycoside hydrolase [Pseudovirgaria hyperparasitica]
MHTDVWNVFVGPVSVAEVNTTVAPTPVPSSELVPPPPLYFAPFPRGQQVPLQTKNESWSFPRDFWWGFASAAYQVEGAVKDEGRGPSIWDVLTHRATNFVVNNDTGDIANNQYYLYKQDIARIAAAGTKAYSFSISWSRIFPFGSGAVNEAGLRHYDDLIQTCHDYGVEPIVTLYHWDLPMILQNSYGGWLSDKIVPDFTEYARIAFSRWGGKVRTWFTMNEPLVFCGTYPLPNGYFKNTSIPTWQQKYFCGHNVLLSHASAYHVGKALYPNISISIKTNGGYKVPLTNSSADAEAVQRAWDFNEGWFANPLFINGDYPQSYKDYVSAFLPDFTPEQSALINDSCDIFAHDAYTSSFYFAPDAGIDGCLANSSNPLYPGCFNSSNTYATDAGGWNIGPAADPGAPWLHKATDWVPTFLHYIQDTWKPRGGIAVSEFGMAEPFESLKTIRADILSDPVRSSYYRDYMQAILIAISEGVNVVGSLAWSIVDNLEWNQGYSVKFGVQYVNLTTQERYFKASFFEYINAFKTYQEQ